MSRAGSPAHMVPCLSAPPSGCRPKPGSQPWQVHMVLNVLKHKGIQHLTPLSSSCWQKVSNRSPDSTLSLALMRTHEGETTLGIAHYQCYSGQSYSGQIQLTQTPPLMQFIATVDTRPSKETDNSSSG